VSAYFFLAMVLDEISLMLGLRNLTSESVSLCLRRYHHPLDDFPNNKDLKLLTYSQIPTVGFHYFVRGPTAIYIRCIPGIRNELLIYILRINSRSV